MGFKDVREWMEKLESEGELKRIKVEVDWNREIGAIARKVSDKMGPALLFENIKDYKTTRCTKVSFGFLGTHGRIALMLGLPKETPARDLIETTRQRFKDPIKPILVNSGPVKENIIKGESIDLYQFPVPFIHKEDGGRFFNTDCAVVTKDPDTDIINIGTYRGMLVSKDKITVRGVSLGRAVTHGGQHYLKFRSIDKPMPIAVAFNWNPAMKFLGSAPIPAGICEYDVMGAIRQEPVPLVKCETVDLCVPAWAEIVLEGTVSHDPNTFEMDGPFGEYTGYYGGSRTLSPVMKVECINHRNDPIYTFALVGVGPGHPEEAAIMTQISATAVLWNKLESMGVPGVRDVYLLPASRCTNVAISIHKTYLGQAKQVAMAVWGSGLSDWMCKNVIVVDDDIDIHDFEALEWAIAYRVNPGENDIVVVPGTYGSILDPSVRVKDREPRLGTAKWNRLLIDATRNWEYEPQEQYGGEIYPPVAFLLDPEDEALVEKRWKEYGLEKQEKKEMNLKFEFKNYLPDGEKLYILSDDCNPLLYLIIFPRLFSIFWSWRGSVDVDNFLRLFIKILNSFRNRRSQLWQEDEITVGVNLYFNESCDDFDLKLKVPPNIDDFSEISKKRNQLNFLRFNTQFFDLWGDFEQPSAEITEEIGYVSSYWIPTDVIEFFSDNKKLPVQEKIKVEKMLGA